MTCPSTYAHMATVARSVGGRFIVRHSWRVAGASGWRHATSAHYTRAAAEKRASELLKAFPTTSPAPA